MPIHDGVCLMNVRPDHHCESSNEVLIDVIDEYGICVFVINRSI